MDCTSIAPPKGVTSAVIECIQSASGTNWAYVIAAAIAATALAGTTFFTLRANRRSNERTLERQLEISQADRAHERQLAGAERLFDRRASTYQEFQRAVPELEAELIRAMRSMQPYSMVASTARAIRYNIDESAFLTFAGREVRQEYQVFVERLSELVDTLEDFGQNAALQGIARREDTDDDDDDDYGDQPMTRRERYFSDHWPLLKASADSYLDASKQFAEAMRREIQGYDA